MKTEHDEVAVAQLLDKLLRGRHVCDELPENSPPVRRALERERGLAVQLAALEPDSPAIVLAQLVYALVQTAEIMFGRESVLWLDFERVAATTEDLQRKLLAQAVIGLKEHCDGGPVAQVIARYRLLALVDEEDRYRRRLQAIAAADR